MWRFQFGGGGRSHILFKRFALETSNRPVKYISNASTKNDFTTWGGGGGLANNPRIVSLKKCVSLLPKIYRKMNGILTNCYVHSNWNLKQERDVIHSQNLVHLFESKAHHKGKLP